MKSLISLKFIFLFFLTSCVSFGSRAYKNLSPFAAPEKTRLIYLKQKNMTDLEKMLDQSLSTTDRWWILYSLGKKSPNKANACQWMTTLSEDPQFPLRELSSIYALDFCESSIPSLDENSTKPIYKNFYYQVLNRMTQRTPAIEDDLTLLKILIPIERDKNKKEKYLLEAIRLTEALNQNDIYELQMELYKNSPRLNPAPRAEDYHAVALDFRFHRSFSKAIEFFNKILLNKKAKPEDKYKAQFEVRQTLKISGQRTQYIAATESLLKLAKQQFKNDPKNSILILNLHDAFVLAAKTFWTEGNLESTYETLSDAILSLKNIHSLAEIYFVQGKVFEEQKLFDLAIESYSLSQNERSIVPELIDQRNWALAWLHYKFNNFSEAALRFQQIILESKSNSEKNRAQFWLAQIYRKNGQDKESMDLFQSLMIQDPLGYYGLLSFRETKSLIAPLPELQKSERIPLWYTDLETSAVLEVDWLISLNELSFAESALKKLLSQISSQKENTLNTLLTLAEAKLYLPLFAEVNKLSTVQKNEILFSHPQLLFPFDFQSLIQNASHRSEVPEELIYSIIRQESAFNPIARSPMDAFGLMQLLPSVASRVAQRNNLPFNSANDLFIPEFNIPIGAFTLKESFKMFDSKFVPAVASYNAPAWAVQRWLKDRARENILEFIEEIPYEETRSYVKLVTRNYVTYQRLIHKKSMLFPELF